MIYRTQIFFKKFFQNDILFIISKDANVILIEMQPPKTQSWNLKYNLEQLGKISNCYFFPSQRHWHVIADRQTIVKLNLKCYILYEIKELLLQNVCYHYKYSYV